MNETKELVHELYNELSTSQSDENMNDVRDALIKVYKRIDSVDDQSQLIGKLTSFIYYRYYADHLNFSPKEDELLSKLAIIGQTSGYNGVYRSYFPFDC